MDSSYTDTTHTNPFILIIGLKKLIKGEIRIKYRINVDYQFFDHLQIGQAYQAFQSLPSLIIRICLELNPTQEKDLYYVQLFLDFLYSKTVREKLNWLSSTDQTIRSDH